MLRLSAVQAMKVAASRNLRLKDVEFLGFESVDETTVEAVADGERDMFAQVDVWAKMRLSFDGAIPESYRVLNAAIMDWVEEHEGDLKKEINPKLIPYLKKTYSDLDTSDLDEDFDDYIWEDQVDYMPDVDEGKGTIDFEIELVLDIDEPEDGE